MRLALAVREMLMRWIVFSLLLFNVGYFAWGMLQQSRLTYHTEPAIKLQKQTGKRLELFSEREGGAKDGHGYRSNSSSAKRIAGIDNECLFLGPFNSSEKAGQLQQRLIAIDVYSTERPDDDRQQLDYWVHVPPLPSRDAAIRLLRELQAQGVDSFVITQGVLANGISLGMFGQEKAAIQTRRLLREAGYSVDIKSMPRGSRKFWLELNAEQEAKLGESFFAEVRKQFPGLKKMKKSCKSIASTDNFP